MLPTLIFVLAVNACKDAYEDWRRRKSDRIENSTPTLRLPPGWQSRWIFSGPEGANAQPKDGDPMTEETAAELKESASELEEFSTLDDIAWADVQVGDLLVIKNREFFPADMVILSSSELHGVAFIETANLDGETNLKLRQVNKACGDLMTHYHWNAWETAANSEGRVECKPPDKDLTTFEGLLDLKYQHLDGAISTVHASLGPEQLLLRGCRLRNTRWIVGVATYTGCETKIQMNATKPHHKFSKLERLMNKLTIFILCTDILVCSVAGITTFFILSGDLNYSYLGKQDQSPAVAAVLTFFTFIILLCNFIPISLIVTLELVKAAQAYFMYIDPDMYDAETDVQSIPRTSDLNEELGQIQYVFSDKTGTLTKNVMDFRKCCIRGKSYGEGLTQVRRTVLKRRGQDPPPDPLPDPHAPKTPNVNFVDSKLEAVMKDSNHKDHDCSVKFFHHLAANHAVIPEVSSTQELLYSASSPDEGALVYGAKHMGVTFLGRDPTGVELDVLGSKQFVKLLASFDFTSERKRSTALMGILPSGSSNDAMEYVVYCKGADSVIFARLAKDPEDPSGSIVKDTDAALCRFAEDGLRTLCFASKTLDPAFAKDWIERYEEAKCLLQNRDEAIARLTEEIEGDLVLQGATGIEDKLQEEVAETIEAMAVAGIVTWMLTGDKLETAMNIGYATSLLTTDGMVEMLDWNTVGRDPGGFDERLVKAHETYASRKKDDTDLSLRLAVVVDTESLDCALTPENQKMFVELCTACTSVICCRATPIQKGEVVTMVKKRQAAITLAIGDGANDCNMIQTAHVGVGIRGREGLQAFNTSDYGLSQFRYLQELLFIHGRWSYRRNSKLVLYMFYKNIVLVMPIFYSAFLSLFSGQKIYNELMYGMYNVFLTALPIIIFALFDQDVDKKTSKALPALYRYGIDNVFFNKSTFLQWILNGVWHSIPIFILPVIGLGFYKVTAPDAAPNDLWLVGQVIFLSVMIVVNIKVYLETSHLTNMTHIAVILSIIAWFVFMIIFAAMPKMAPEVAGLAYRILLTPMVYLLVTGSCCISLTRDVVWKVYIATFKPQLHHQIQYATIEGKGPLDYVPESIKKPFKQIEGLVPPQLRIRHTNYAFQEPDPEVVQHVHRENFRSQSFLGHGSLNEDDPGKRFAAESVSWSSSSSSIKL